MSLDNIKKYKVTVAVLVLAAVILLTIFIVYRRQKSSAIENFENTAFGYWTSPQSFNTQSNLKMMALFIGEASISSGGETSSYLLMIDNNSQPVFNGFIDIKFIEEVASAEANTTTYKILIKSEDLLPDGWDDASSLRFEMNDRARRIRIYRGKNKKEMLAILYKDNEISEIIKGE